MPGAPIKALVAGFEPFGGEPVNPAAQALHALPPEVAGLAVATVQLPTVFDRCAAVLEAAIEAHDPAIVLAIGQAGGRAELCLERVAVNIDDARIADNDGHQPIDRPVVRGGPAAYFATLPIKAAVAALREAGLPAAVSNTAGTFVCNHLFYALMHLAALREGRFRAGFLHLPYLPSQAARQPGAASMALADIARGIEIVLAVAAERRRDIEAAEGTIS